MSIFANKIQNNPVAKKLKTVLGASGSDIDIKRLEVMGYDKNFIEKIECTIGKNSIIGKEPDVIAISIIARLLEFKSNLINNQIKKQIKLVHG